MLIRINEAIKHHYAMEKVGDTLLAALEKSGKNLNQLTTADLAPIDEFHIRGRAATLELAEAAGLKGSQRVLDIGSGIGGTSRCLAETFGCRVTGIDLTEEYCRVAAMLSERTGLSHLVDFRQGDATDLPFFDHQFDVVWTEHVAMNIEDKARLYQEMFRVLKPGGTLAIYDIFSGDKPVLYPVPWARTPDTSFLVRPDEMRALLENSGFAISAWNDTTFAAREWFVALIEKIRRHGIPPLGFHLLLGEQFPQMAENQGRNLQEGRIRLGQIVATK